MTDQPITTIRASYERVAQSTCGLPQYESARALVSVEETFPGTMNPDDVANIVANQFLHAKSAVLNQLGIAFAQDELGILRESFGDVAVVASHPAAAGSVSVARPPLRTVPAAAPVAPVTPLPQRPAPVAPAPPVRPPAAATGQHKPEDDGYWAELMDNPGRWRDQRPAKASGAAKPGAPDFVSMDHKEGRFFKGLWLNSVPDWFADPFGA